jgi:DNA mismatch repair protein MutS
MAKTKKETPLMTQYNTIKAKYPDALCFSVDFYETFGQDAEDISDWELFLPKEITEGSVELAGFPHHSIDSYLPKLVRAGMRVRSVISWKIRKW